MIVAHFKDRNASLINRQDAKSTKQVKRLGAFAIFFFALLSWRSWRSWRLGGSNVLLLHYMFHQSC